MNNFAWHYPKTKPQVPVNATKDVLLSVVKSGKTKDGKQRYDVCFRFTPGAVNFILPDPVCFNMTFAVGSGKKVYFKPDERGFKLTKARYSHRQSISAHTDHVKFWLAHTGAYDLKYDKAERLLYIDLEENCEEGATS